MKLILSLLFIACISLSGCQFYCPVRSYHSLAWNTPYVIIENKSIPNDSLNTPVQFKVVKEKKLDHAVSASLKINKWHSRIKYTSVYQDLRLHLNDVLLFPKEALEEGKCGQVLVQFKIDNNGDLQNVELLGKGIHPAIDMHVIDVISKCKVNPVFKNQRKALNRLYQVRFLFSSQDCMRKDRRYRVKRYLWKKNWIYEVYSNK